MLKVLDPSAARRWALTALAALADARDEIDALNVFPVPDGDTGTNLYLTLEAAVAAVQALPPGASVPVVADAFARGALLGARGNSGVIGAQLLRGWAQVLAQHGELTPAAAVECFRRADEEAWKAVQHPVEGTILSVSRAAAQAAAATATADPDADLETVVSSAAEAAHLALARTPVQLPALAAAGVVDAGGRGLVVLLDALADVVMADQPHHHRRRRRPADLPAIELPPDLGHTGEPVNTGFAVHSSSLYEVMFLLDTDPALGEGPVDGLRERLDQLGDSLVIVGGPELWQVHVHVEDAGAAVESAIAAGVPHQIRITHLGAGQPDAALAKPVRNKAVGLVACAAGPGLAELFESTGAVVVAGGPGRRASMAGILSAIHQTRATDVAVLPNDADTLNVARIAAASARSDGLRVTVIPTRAQVQGLAAAAVHDPARRFDDDVVSMSAAAGAARDGAVTLAVRNGLTSAGECRIGDALGVVDGDFVVIGADLTPVAIEVLRRLLAAGGELVTLVVGAGGHEGLARSVAAHARGLGRGLEVNVVNGGQPRYPLLIGVE